MDTAIDIARSSYRKLIARCAADGGFCLTPKAEASPYATCFAVFGLHLLRDEAALRSVRESVARGLIGALRSDAKRRIAYGKPYRQLLAFTLSALSVLSALDEDPLADLVREQMENDVDVSLRASGALEGRPQSGNFAMFTAVFLVHAQRYLGMETQGALDRWVTLHLQRMNRIGFWGFDKGMTHLAFQNGYHQYEIFEYLGIRNPKQDAAISAVLSLADHEGHFAPYPGGGACYDYDAVFILTPEGRSTDQRTVEVLHRARQSILTEQIPDGGFAESLRVRPRSLRNVRRMGVHVASAWGNWPLFGERLRQAITLQRPKHDRIHTHWSRYSRRWDEANLWDSWFRMLTLARIEVALDPSKANEWGFINYPGIGFHPSVRRYSPIAV